MPSAHLRSIYLGEFTLHEIIVISPSQWKNRTYPSSRTIDLEEVKIFAMIEKRNLKIFLPPELIQWLSPTFVPHPRSSSTFPHSSTKGRNKNKSPNYSDAFRDFPIFSLNPWKNMLVKRMKKPTWYSPIFLILNHPSIILRDQKNNRVCQLDTTSIGKKMLLPKWMRLMSWSMSLTAWAFKKKRTKNVKIWTNSRRQNARIHQMRSRRTDKGQTWGKSILTFRSVFLRWNPFVSHDIDFRGRGKSKLPRFGDSNGVWLVQVRLDKSSGSSLIGRYQLWVSLHERRVWLDMTNWKEK